MKKTDLKPATSLAKESRFEVSPLTLFADRWVGRIIRAGGICVVLAVFGMMAFLVIQVIPLFIGAKVAQIGTLIVPDSAVAFGEDADGELPYVVLSDGRIQFQRSADGSKDIDWSPKINGLKVTAVQNYSRNGLVFLGLSDGSILEVRISYRPTFDTKGKRMIKAVVTAGEPTLIGKKGLPCIGIWNAKSSNTRLLIVQQKEAEKSLLTAVRLTERAGLGGKVRVSSGTPFLVASDAKVVEKVLLPSNAESLIIIGSKGEVRTYVDDGKDFTFLQSFVPFKDSRVPEISTAGLIFLEGSVVFVNPDGEQQIWSMYPQVQADGSKKRRWGMIHEWDKLPGACQGIYAAENNKCYLAVAGGKLQIRNMTTGSLRWESDAPNGGQIRYVSFGVHYNRLNALSADGKLYRWSIDDPHPVASWDTFFGKIWYEGASEPTYSWQSGASSDDFEKKFSLVPLIYGTAKATFYALLFALPIALAAAVYVSQFIRPSYRRVVKPVMEIMASLPSVVLGFLAGLWLAPIVDSKLVPIFCSIIILPIAAISAGYLWSISPQRIRRMAAPGTEFIWLLPYLSVCVFLAWQVGPIVEAALFSVKDSVSGLPVADFREWWRQTTGETYDSRNSLVVGFVMGFSVIPIIFTIAEDSISNVPSSLVSGSLALGASRWQTVWKIVLPTAITGIVSSVIIGFGRAVGETMIVVMATGNTAVMDLNPFSGMRTLSANIAVELPEAPAGDTHFRALFLGALCLFLFTFIANTLAEILRQHLRKRYKVT